jgi:hypothetical protein
MSITSYRQTISQSRNAATSSTHQLQHSSSVHPSSVARGHSACRDPAHQARESRTKVSGFERMLKTHISPSKVSGIRGLTTSHRLFLHCTSFPFQRRRRLPLTLWRWFRLELDFHGRSLSWCRRLNRWCRFRDGRRSFRNGRRGFRDGW